MVVDAFSKKLRAVFRLKIPHMQRLDHFRSRLSIQSMLLRPTHTYAIEREQDANKECDHNGKRV